MPTVNGYFLAIVLISTLVSWWLLLYAMPPSSKRGRYQVQIWARHFLGPTALKWQATYRSEWLAHRAARAKVRRMTFWGMAQWEPEISWKVKYL